MAEADILDLLTVEQAIRIIDATPVAPRIVAIALHEAQGLRLASDLFADRDYPPFDKSLMDGYAVRCADVTESPTTLRIAGEIAAGQAAQRPVGPGEAMAIMTGAPLPPAADGVVPVEDVEIDRAQGSVRIRSSAQPGRYISRRGADARAGDLVLARGTRLESAQLAAAASIGAARVQVYAAPRVSVLSTGDELVPIDQEPGAAQIRNSNNLMLVALLRKMGCDVRDLGTAPDDPKQIGEAIVEGMKSDVLFVTGGMSMGQYDYVPRILRELAVDLKITKLRIKPGKPFVFGIAPPDQQERSCSIFGLPGNPVSAFVCTVRLASRLLMRLAGGAVEERWLTGRLESGLPVNGPREFYQPVRRTAPAGAKSAAAQFASIVPLAWKGSADVFTLAAANALLVRAENEPAMPIGTMVRVLEI